MNTNPKAKRVLIFGDSNTWGDPADGSVFRYGPTERYPGILQDLLGMDYEIIEEGMPGRTICATSPREEEKGRVGIDYLSPCLDSHFPFDLLIINLGTNEFKKRFALTAEDVAINLEKMCQRIVDESKEAPAGVPIFETLILAPGYVDEEKAGEEFEGFGYLSREVAPLFEKVAHDFNFHFFNLGEIATPGDDGLHYSPESHRRVAEVLQKEIQSILAA